MATIVSSFPNHGALWVLAVKKSAPYVCQECTPILDLAKQFHLIHNFLPSAAILFRLDPKKLHDIGEYLSLFPDIGAELLRGPTEQHSGIHGRDDLR